MMKVLALGLAGTLSLTACGPNAATQVGTSTLLVGAGLAVAGALIVSSEPEEDCTFLCLPTEGELTLGLGLVVGGLGGLIALGGLASASQPAESGPGAVAVDGDAEAQRLARQAVVVARMNNCVGARSIARRVHALSPARHDELLLDRDYARCAVAADAGVVRPGA